MSENARTYPPGTIIVADRITLTRENFGGLFLRWPYEYSSGTVYDATPTDHRSTYPQGRPQFFDADLVTSKLGWIRSFYPTCLNLYSAGGSLSTQNVDALLNTLDFWYTRGVKLWWTPGFINNHATDSTWGASYPYTTTAGEQIIKDFCEALMSSARTSDLGYTMANHPGLGAVELCNEVSVINAAGAASAMRIVRKTFEKYRTQPTTYLMSNLEGSNRSGTPKDWIQASALSAGGDPGGVGAGSPLDYGTSKKMLDYADAWNHHYYAGLNTRTTALAANNTPSTTHQGVRYSAALHHTNMNYFYCVANGTGKWHHSSGNYFPPIWNGECDIAGGETAEGSDGFMWGQLHPDARKALFMRYFVPTIFATHNGSGSPGVSTYYTLDGTRQDRDITIGSASVSGGRIRLTLSPTSTGTDFAPTYGYGAYDDLVIYGGSAGWPELGIAAGGYKRFIGENTSGTPAANPIFDLMGTEGATSAGSIPSGALCHWGRLLYVDIATYIWLSDLLRSAPVTFGFVAHAKSDPADAPNLGIMLHVEGRRPWYTDASGNLLRW